jgi:hypothetical protein
MTIQEVNYAEMTDDEMMNIDDSDYQLEDENTQKTNESDNEEEELDADVEFTDEIEESDDEESESQEESEDKDAEEEEDSTQEESSEDGPDETGQVAEESDEEPNSEVLAPLRANGKDLKLNSVAELRNLASMGANYSLKMQQLKPHLKLLKTLEKNGLLEDDKINHLISLTQGDKHAISKLLKDSDIDPDYMDLPDSDSNYEATDHIIPESEIALDEVLDEISSSDFYSTTMDILGNKWDADSRAVIASNPQSVRTMHDHVENGMYAKISAEVERQRMLGNLNTHNDLQAYDLIGQQMQEAGAFNPTADSGSTANRKAQRKAAGSTKNRGSTKKTPKKAISEYDILNMSDDEIEALSVPGLT